MNNIVRPWKVDDNSRQWQEMIETLYAESDRSTEDQGQTIKARKPLNNSDDISLVDDVLDALMDPMQAKIARPVLRHALKEIAKATLLANERNNSTD